MDIEHISELIRLFSANGLKKLDVSDGNVRLVLESHDTPALPTREAGQPLMGGQPSLIKAAAEDNFKEPEADAFIQTSPVVGTVYLSSVPGGQPLVSIGDTVTVGQPLCIVEAMKMYSNLTAHAAGIIKEICVENGQPVGVGQELFKIVSEQRNAS